MRYAQIIQRFPPEWQAPLWELVEALREDMQDQLAARRRDLEMLMAAVERLAEVQRRTEEQLRALAEAQRQTKEAR